jgi:quercetin dioxygenase-like cupin family protein
LSSTVHKLIRRDEIDLQPLPSGQNPGLRTELVLGEHTGTTHTGIRLVELDAGHVGLHLHSFESTFYILSGTPELYLDERWVRLRPGACGAIPVGVEHAWRDHDHSRWLEMMSPRPRPDNQPPDTFFLGAAPNGDAGALDLRDPRNRNLFLLRDEDMNREHLKQGAAVDEPAVSASMATAALAYSGITVKMLVDKRLDAHLQTMFMVDYEPGAVVHPHDHPFEESYYMLEGEIDAVADGERYTLRPGDLFWTGVGCLHAFYETQGKRVRWLETSAPGPPDRHSYRFERDWQYLAARLAEAPTP